MAQIVQFGNAISNTSTMTVSTWFRLPSPLPLPFDDHGLIVGPGDSGGYCWGLYDLLAFGNTSAYEFQGYNSISLHPQGRGIAIYLKGPPSGTMNALSMTAETNQDPQYSFAYGGIPMDSSILFANALFGEYQPGIFYPYNTVLSSELWYHLFVSVDTSGTDSFIIGGGPPNQVFTLGKKIDIFINGQDVFHGLGSDTGGSNYVQNALAVAWPDHETFPEDVVECPGFEISISGRELAIPTISEFLFMSPIIGYGDTQVWFGTYIEPTEQNLEKFVSVANGVGRPVHPSVAAEAFGEPDFLFRGDKKQFPINKGTGGIFTQVGTITNIPPPSFMVL